MYIEFLSEEGLDILKKFDLSSNASSYNGSNDWIKYKYPEILKKFDKKEFSDFNLIHSSDPKSDFENMKIIYEALKDLTDSQASDERIWAGLSHTYCWNYMQERWPLPEDKSKWNSHILNNYFFWNGSHAVFLNGISRLWWYARYTYNASFDNPYELTQYICDNDINGKIYPLVSCVFANNKKVFQCIIKSIKEYEEKHDIKLTRDEFNEVKKYLNRYSGKSVLDFLDENDITNIVLHKIDLMKN